MEEKRMKLQEDEIERETSGSGRRGVKNSELR